MRVLAIDPGQNVGFCLKYAEAHYKIWQTYYITGDSHLQFYNHLYEVAPDKVIYEPFTFQQNFQDKPKIEYVAAEMVGIIKFYCQETSTQMIPQPASSVVGKTAFWGDSGAGNARIKATGLWDSTKYPHGMDALRHMLYYETFTLHDKRWLRMLPKD